MFSTERKAFKYLGVKRPSIWSSVFTGLLISSLILYLLRLLDIEASVIGNILVIMPGTMFVFVIFMYDCILINCIKKHALIIFENHEKLDILKEIAGDGILGVLFLSSIYSIVLISANIIVSVVIILTPYFFVDKYQYMIPLVALYGSTICSFMAFHDKFCLNVYYDNPLKIRKKKYN